MSKELNLHLSKNCDLHTEKSTKYEKKCYSLAIFIIQLKAYADRTSVKMQERSCWKEFLISLSQDHEAHVVVTSS